MEEKPPSPEEAPETVDASPPDVDALEAEIRGRLKNLMARARKSKADAQAVFAKVKPMLRTGEAVTEITEGRNAAVGQMADRAREAYSATGENIRRLTDEVHDAVLFQRELIAGMDETSREQAATLHGPAERYFDAVRRRKGEIDGRAESIRRWLGEAEARWLAGEPRGEEPPKADGPEAGHEQKAES